jgi:ferredoxin
MPTVTFIIASDQVRTVEAEKGATLLSIALDAGVPMESACGGNGFCTTCMCRKVSGELGGMTDREEGMGVEEPNRLGCQATVEGDTVVELLDTE